MATPPSTALVVGAAGGIGSAVCRRLSRRGYQLALVDLSRDSLGALEAALHREGSRVLARSLDASSADVVIEFVAEAESTLGPVDVLVNCNGLFRIQPIATTTDSMWSEAINANLTSVFVSCREVAPRMVQRGRGSIINIASAAGEMGSVRPAAHYAAAKGGVIAFSKSLAREVSPHGVRVNVVSPGPIDTSMLQLTADAKSDRARVGTLLGRIGQPDEVASAIEFLAGEGATFITGAVVRVNGGALL